MSSFGSLLPGRFTPGTDYRYGFQGQEKDDELKGEGNSLNYAFRMHDPRVGRFFAVDPLTKEYPELTPYQFASNSPIDMIELEGMEGRWVVNDKFVASFQSRPRTNGFDSEGVARYAASKGIRTPEALKSYMEWMARIPKVQKTTAEIRCACAQCIMKSEPYLYLGGENSIGNPVFQYATLNLFTGGTSSLLLKALPKAKLATKVITSYNNLSKTKKIVINMTSNATSQIYLKKDIKKINLNEVIMSAVSSKPAVNIAATTFGESVNINIESVLDGNYIKTESLPKTLTQVGLGLVSMGYADKTDKLLGGENSAGVAVGEGAKFVLETLSNQIPDTMFPDEGKVQN